MSELEGLAMPEVSVVIPTRDRSRLLALTLHSVCWQRGVDLEVVVVDDGSTDDTAETVAAFADPRIRLVRQPVAQGVSAARNRGIAEAQGRWVAFLDDDDLWAPDKLVRQLEAARGTGRAWVYTGAVNVDQRQRILDGGPPAPPERVIERLGRYNAVPAGASNVVVRADALARAGAFDIGLRNNEDWDLWIRLARLGPPAWVCRPLVALRVHPGNASRNMDRMLQELDVIERRHRIPVDRAAHYRWAAWTCLRDGRQRTALRYYAQAVRVGDLTSVARALVALVRPAVAEARVARQAHSNSAGQTWIAEAQAWLNRLLPLAGLEPPPARTGLPAGERRGQEPSS
jgi:glycosyltransferase involved in cell wall biosynthesis